MFEVDGPKSVVEAEAEDAANTDGSVKPMLCCAICFILFELEL
jgi:hypothetical protein